MSVNDPQPAHSARPEQSGAPHTGDDTTVKVPRKKTPHPIFHSEIAICWILLAAMIVVNALREFGVLDPSTRDMSNAALAWFTPDRYVSLIWIPIYALLALWLVRMGNTKQRRKKTGPLPVSLQALLFIVAAVIQVGWLLAWGFNQYWLAILAAFMDTILIYLLGYHTHKKDTSIWGWAPFTLFGTWMLLETIIVFVRVICLAFAKSGDINNTAQGVCTVALTVVILAVGAFMRFKFHDWIFGIVALWTIIGIAFHIMDVSKFTGVLIIVVATIGALITYIPWNRVNGHLSKLDTTTTGKKITR